MSKGFWAGFDLVLGGLLIILAVILSLLGQDWRLVGVLGAGFTLWGIFEWIRGDRGGD
ncbi:MAG: hypothetical protein VX727_01895 [Planctomycetota bacterium]|nr:hypothetical protein [Planctomycetota bacterium]